MKAKKLSEFKAIVESEGFTFECEERDLRKISFETSVLLKQIYTLCHSFEEANALGHFIMSKGYEGVQNDSYRYCKEQIELALKYNHRHHHDYCFIGVNGGCMVIGKDKKEMRSKLSMKYIEKERVFRDLLTDLYEEFRKRGKNGF